MLNALFKPTSSPAQDAGSDAAAVASPYVHSVMLEELDDIGSAELIWHQPRAFSFGSRPLRLRQVVDEASFRLGRQALVPDSVVVEVAAETIERDRRIGGQLSIELAESLSTLHARDFGSRLPLGKSPRYRVQPANDLPPGKLRVRLGPAIHVAQPGEAVLWRVEVSADGVVWDSCQAFEVTEYQRLFILSGSGAHGSQVCPVWPFPSALGLALLNEPGSTSLELSAEPLQSLRVQHHAQAGWYTVREASSAATGLCLYVRISRVAAQTQPSSATTSQRVAPDIRLVADTPRATGAPVRSQPAAPKLPASPVQAVPTEARVEPRLEPSTPSVPPASPAPVHPAPAKVAASNATPPAAKSVPTPSVIPLTVAPPVSGPSALPPASTGAAPAVLPSAQTTASEVAASPVSAPAVPTSLPRPVDADNAPTLVTRRTPAAAPAPCLIDDAPTLLARRPVPVGRLALQGLAVQRVSLYAEQGVDSLEWGLNAAGLVVPPQAPGVVLRFEVTPLDELRVHTRNGQRQMAPGEAVPMPGGEGLLQLQAVPQVLADWYLGWLSLPRPPEDTLAFGQACKVGRLTEALKALRPLSGSGFLPKLPQAGADRMGLSRDHAELVASPQGLSVVSHSTGLLMHLDEKMLPLATLKPNQPALLTRGQHLVLGHYVWKYLG